MSRPLRPLGRAVALLLSGLGVLAGAGPAAAAGPAQPVRAKVVIIAVPDLRWADLATMPRLRALAATSSVAELSVKTVSGTPRCADGSVTFSAGNRADADDANGRCGLSQRALAAVRANAREQGFAAHVGAFGDAVRRAGLTTAAVGADAVPLLADSRGRVGAVVPSLAAAVRRGAVVAVVDEGLYYSPTATRPAAARRTDTRIGDQLAAVPPGVPVVVAGTSDGYTTAMHLHVLVVHGTGWRHVALRSPSTRPPFVQIRDLAPTVLAMLGIPVPSVMVGAPATPTATAASSPAAYASDDDHAVTARVVGIGTRLVLAELPMIVVLLLLIGAEVSGRLVAPRWQRRASAAGRWLAVVVVGAPVCSFLVQVLPWWRWPTWTYTALVAAGSLVVGAAVALAARRRPVVAFAVGPAVTAAVLIADQFAGAPLQLSAPLGDNPIVAGRFHGMGNTAFALMCTAMLLLAGVAAGALQRRRRPLGALLVAGALCVLAIVVDAAPSLGDDFGGVLAMGPAAAVLLLLLARVRLSWRRIVAIVVGVLALAVAVAFADYSRPARQQTHIGRFVGQVLHGGAGAVLQRKLASSLASFGNAALTIFVIVLIVAVALAWRQLRAAVDAVPGLPPAAVAVAVLAVLGTFLNDSGVVVAWAALTLAVLAFASARLCGSERPGGDNEAVPQPPLTRSAP